MNWLKSLRQKFKRNLSLY